MAYLMAIAVSVCWQKNSKTVCIYKFEICPQTCPQSTNKFRTGLTNLLTYNYSFISKLIKYKQQMNLNPRDIRYEDNLSYCNLPIYFIVLHSTS